MSATWAAGGFGTQAQVARDAQLARNFWTDIQDGQRRRKLLDVIGRFSQAQAHRYLERLKDVLGYCLTHEVTGPMYRFCRQELRRGAPIDPKVLYIPRPSMKIVLRQLVTAIPTMAKYHGDARLWLKSSAFRPVGTDVNGARVYGAMISRTIGGRTGMQYEKPFDESYIPFNLLLYAPKDSPYEKLQKQGFLLELEED